MVQMQAIGVTRILSFQTDTNWIQFIWMLQELVIPLVLMIGNWNIALELQSIIRAIILLRGILIQLILRYIIHGLISRQIILRLLEWFVLHFQQMPVQFGIRFALRFLQSFLIVEFYLIQGMDKHIRRSQSVRNVG